MFRRTLCTFLAIVCMAVCALTQTEQQKSGDKLSTLDERLGPDDGAALAILFGANMRGNLSTCD